MTQAGKGNLFNTLWMLGKKLFSFKSAIPITLILILATSISAIDDSLEQKSFMPFLKQVGGKVWNYENALYMEAVRLEENGGIKVDGQVNSDNPFGVMQYIWKLIMESGRLLINIWWMYFFFLLLYKFTEFFLVMDKSRITSNFMGAFIFLILIELLSGVFVLDEKLELGEIDEDSKILPGRGIFKTISVLPLLASPISDNQNVTTQVT